MKKILLLSLLTITSISASAQIKWGVKGGVNVSSLTGKPSGAYIIKPSIYLGAFAELSLSDKWAIQPELVYSRQGAIAEMEPENVAQRINYLNVPIMAKYYICDRWSVEAGPQIGVRLNAKVAYSNVTEENTKEVKFLDFGLGLGSSFNVTEKIAINARYNFGVSDINKSDYTTTRNSVFQLGVSVTL